MKIGIYGLQNLC